MFHPEAHKAILGLAMTSVGTAALHAVDPVNTLQIVKPGPDWFSIMEPWIHVIGGIVGILAGLASISWYLYSFIKARRAEGDD